MIPTLTQMFIQCEKFGLHISQRRPANELDTCCTPCFPPAAQVPVLPHQLSEEMSALRGLTGGFIIPRVCCGQEADTLRRRECAALAAPKTSPHWPCPGRKTDGAAPLKAWYQLTTRLTPSSTHLTPLQPIHTHSE